MNTIEERVSSSLKTNHQVVLGDKKDELARLLIQLEERKKSYGILSSSMGKVIGQRMLFDDMIDRLNYKINERKRFYLYYGGNGGGKSFAGAYITVLLALGFQTKKYGLPYIGEKKNIWVCTKSGSNVKSTIAPYLIGDYSNTRIPPDEIERITQDNGILKAIRLKNGCEIHIKTYDQGQENVQGGNPDWMWLDEEPVNKDVWGELKARTRKAECEMLITMTPLNGLTGVYDFFFSNDNEELKKRCAIYRVSSLDNPFTDKTWTLGMTDEEYRLRVDGSFESPTGLVYNKFSRSKNIVSHFEPEELGRCLFYRGIDFGTSHPTGVVFVAVDDDDNVYVFDEIRKSNTTLGDIVKEIEAKSKGKVFEFFVRDSASAREGLELKKTYGIDTVPADKRSKGPNDMSNRRAGIMMINDMLASGKLMISDRCGLLIKEFESHYYKDGNKDGDVIKTDDDLLDALRYLLFIIKKKSTPQKVRAKTVSQKQKIKKVLREKYGVGMAYTSQ